MQADARQDKLTNDLKSRATKLVDLLAQGKFADAHKTFDRDMQKAFSPEKLRDAWQSTVAEVGEFKRQAGARLEKIDQYNIVLVTCEFAKAKLDIRVVFDGDKKIAGLFIVPPKQAAADTYQPPAYVNREKFTEQSVTIGTGQTALPGTLTLPKGDGPFPAVVLVHGSGPQDRDETIGPNKPFRDLAWGLASQGIAVLRYDKRTKVHPAQFTGSFTVKEETTDDAIAAVNLLRQTPAINPTKVFVLGHSLGGMLAPRIAQQETGVAGIIILAGNTRPFEDLFVAQSTYLANLDGNVTKREKETINLFKQQVDRIKDRDLAKQPANELLLGAPPAYWLDLRTYKQQEVAKELKQPLLILQGERDYQVTMDDLRGWQKALDKRPNTAIKSYPNLNHLFVAGTEKSTPKDYQTAGHVDAVVITDIATWINQQVTEILNTPTP